MKLRSYFSGLVVAGLLSEITFAQIRTDGSVGSGSQTLLAPGGQYTVPQTLGRLAGDNLFHSFQDFNVNAGETATFITSSSGISNVVSRVTGGNVSNINGTLALKPAEGAPAFWFINPAGVVFGKGAALDMPGAFHVSTAHYLKFSDGRFYSDIQKVSTFSSAPPEAFGFLGSSRASIEVNAGAKLSNRDSTLNLTAGDITIDGSEVRNAAGAVNLVAMGAAVGEVSTSGLASKATAGTVQITNTALVGTETSSEANGGDVSVTAGSLLVDKSTLSSKTVGSGNGGATRIQVADVVSVLNGSYVGTETIGAGDAGAVAVTAGALSIDNSGLAGDTSGSGRGGAVSVNVAGVMEVLNEGYVSSTSIPSLDQGSVGNAGDVSVTAGSLLIDRKASINSDTYGSGHAGAVSVYVISNMKILNEGFVSSTSVSPISEGIGGNAGNISVTAGTLLIDKASINSDTYGSGHAGAVSVNVAGDMKVLNEGFVSSTSASPFSEGIGGNAGNVSVTAGRLLIDKGTINSDTYGGGHAGAVSVNVAGDIKVLNEGAVTSDSRLPLNEGSGGNAGVVSVTAGSLLIDQSSISSYTYGSGHSGSVSIKVAGDISVLNESNVSSSTESSGNAGVLNVAVAGNISLMSGAQIGSNTFGAGNAGSVLLTAGSLLIDSKDPEGLRSWTGIFSGSQYVEGFSPTRTGDAGIVDIRVVGSVQVLSGGGIHSSTLGGGNAGSVSVSAGSLLIDPRGHGLRETILNSSSDLSEGISPVPGGDAGMVNIRVVGELTVLDGGIIASATRSPLGKAGTVNISAGRIVIDGVGKLLDHSQSSLITASAYSASSGQTGSVLISAVDSIKIANGAVVSVRNDATAATPGTLNPTTLLVNASKVSLENGGMITTESAGNVAASNISVNFSDKLLIKPGAIITTSAIDGNGGSIDITGNGLIVLDRSQITTSVTGSTSGNAGIINIAAKTLLMSNGFIQANTAAPLASGGTISISAEALVPSYGTLLVGGNTPLDFDAVKAGFNVIQAASPTGVSGNISITSPNLDMAGKLAGLKVSLLDTGGFSKNPCASAGKSSFSQTGRGGLPTSSFGALSSENTMLLGPRKHNRQESLAAQPHSLLVSNQPGCSLN